MTAYEIILKKRNGGALSKEEIEFMVQGFTAGTLPDYQMAAFLMTVYFRGMNPEELGHLTMAMVNSGEVIDLSFMPGRKLDKHSSGGVGDKTSLVVCPLVAACGVPVAKMSGRGLGHTGGTLDKLESIPGFRVDLSPDEFKRAVLQSGLAIVGQTARLVPADGLMYALRDVIAAVDSIPLIASSIMSKKIAGGADAIVLDVKVGSGAFMKEDRDGIELARTMVNIGSQVGKETVALVTDMDQPLGVTVGNALEVKEAIETLSMKGPRDLLELSVSVAQEMVSLGLGIDLPAAKIECEKALLSGRALEKFRQMVKTQGGDPRVVDRPNEVLPRAPITHAVCSPREGSVASIDTLSVGMAAAVLGAGRRKKGDPVDHSVGVLVEKKVGDRVNAGERLFTVHARSLEDALVAERMLLRGVALDKSARPRGPVVRYRVDSRGVQSFI